MQKLYFTGGEKQTSYGQKKVHTVQHRIVQYCIVQYSTLQYITVHYRSDLGVVEAAPLLGHNLDQWSVLDLSSKGIFFIGTTLSSSATGHTK